VAKKNKIEDIVASYRRALLTPEGKVIVDDLRKFSMIDEQAGSSLSLEEMVYRNALQDVYRYVEAMISED
jgi:hypothetical protein